RLKKTETTSWTSRRINSKPSAWAANTIFPSGAQTSSPSLRHTIIRNSGPAKREISSTLYWGISKHFKPFRSQPANRAIQSRAIWKTLSQQDCSFIERLTDKCYGKQGAKQKY